MNSALADNPALVNQSPYGEGWMIKLKPTGPDPLKSLMSSEEYEKLLEEQHG